MNEATGPGAPAPTLPSHAKTQYDALLVPDGRKIGDVAGGLATLLLGLSIPGVSHEQGRSENAACYAAHIGKIENDAAKKAVADWLASKRAAV